MRGDMYTPKEAKVYTNFHMKYGKDTATFVEPEFVTCPICGNEEKERGMTCEVCGDWKMD